MLVLGNYLIGRGRAGGVVYLHIYTILIHCCRSETGRDIRDVGDAEVHGINSQIKFPSSETPNLVISIIS